MKLQYKTYSLPFHHPFTISKGTKTHQPTLIVELDFMGIKGYGEAPAIAYYNITVEKMVEDLERKKMFVEKFAFSDPESDWLYFVGRIICNSLVHLIRQDRTLNIPSLRSPDP